MMGSDGRDRNNTVIGELSVHVSWCRRKGRTDSTFVCSSSWIHSNHAERVGPIVDCEGMVDLMCLNEMHSVGSLAGEMHDDLDRTHLKSRGGGSLQPQDAIICSRPGEQPAWPQLGSAPIA